MAGIAQRKSEAFGPLMLDLRRHLDAALLIIEHDIPLVSSISDRLYCLETGVVIAEGSPDEVRGDPRVVASYLGTDDRAILRRGDHAPAAALVTGARRCPNPPRPRRSTRQRTRPRQRRPRRSWN